ncbi:MAG: ABC transporter permease [Chloroflexota bacterium]|nr:ABC transporter permease [Chloroflexota bacterium]
MTGPTSDAITPPRREAPGRGPISLVRTGVAEILERRRLTRYLVGAELKQTHADTAFGQLWWILDPLLQMAVYFVLVVIIFNRPTPAYPLFIFVAILPWKWFTASINEAMLSITGRQNLIRQIQFPKIILPTAAVVAGSMSFLFGLIALGIVYLFYLDRVSIWLICLPAIAAIQFVFTLALGILFSALNAFFRDVQNVLGHALRLWFYLSPALYSLDGLEKDHPTVATLLALNPFAVLFDSYRAVTWGTSPPDWIGLGIVLAFSLALLALAIYLFKRVEPSFARIL